MRSTFHLCVPIPEQHDLLAVRILFDQEHVEHVEQFDLLLVERLEAEFRQHRLQELRGVQLGLGYDGVDDVVVEFAQKGLQQRRLARTDLAGDDDETVGEPDRRFHVGLGARVLLAPVDELRIGRQSEGLLVQLEMFEVRHAR